MPPFQGKRRTDQTRYTWFACPHLHPQTQKHTHAHIRFPGYVLHSPASSAPGGPTGPSLRYPRWPPLHSQEAASWLQSWPQQLQVSLPRPIGTIPLSLPILLGHGPSKACNSKRRWQRLPPRQSRLRLPEGDQRWSIIPIDPLPLVCLDPQCCPA